MIALLFIHVIIYRYYLINKKKSHILRIFVIEYVNIIE